ncbi:NAD-dependent epimerase/dehydratase family protein [Cellulomonas sp. S1-8]|uniref:NAD-dependent epimerase/dehydratase family protein n=1 Tax=Cellulomonas sp. S1-8 TaxID=2904790 RepID=UPI002244F264|nr:NAD-dependent epimerase/dehydratase family protein [Cellulomonas sp. S1-8]UZN02121.1 NAD-dependent epimerase/dehydratase family protein [Cellulomonas sp. S1-8]
MARHTILGKGPIGRTLATHLADAGHDVHVLSRSGPRPGAPARTQAASGGSIEHHRVDGTDADALTARTGGSVALYNCVNPAYHRWATDWPPVAAALLAAATRTDAVLVIAGNLYGYGAGHPHMRESDPLASRETKGRVRAQMWADALARHDAGALRTTEVRGSDYLGPGAEAHAHAGPRMLTPLLAGRVLRPIASADRPHTWTYLPDFAAALARAAELPDAWGRPWHVPSPEPQTYREVAERFAKAAGAPTPRISPAPLAAVRLLGLVNPMMREIAGVAYQFDQPFVTDDTASRRVLGLEPTGWDTIVTRTLAAHRAEHPAGQPVGARR